MSSLRLILGDQLSQTISSLQGCDQTEDKILMCEVWEEATYVEHHKKKIAFLFSAMRHFCRSLRRKGYQVIYTTLDDENNTGSFLGEVQRICNHYSFKKIIVTYPGEYRLLKHFETWQPILNTPVFIKPDDRFLCALPEFRAWAGGRKSLKMEYFYRQMRRKYNVLICNNKPIGGRWNYDTENRKFPKERLTVPDPVRCQIDEITQTVIDMVSQKFPDHFGELLPFSFAVTRDQALEVLNDFIDVRLTHFGEYQDVMLQREPWMYHSHISFYLNCGLLLPLECIKAAEKAYHDGKVPLNSAEGFIRQIMGWREYIRGIYWQKMPGYSTENFFQAKRSLPNFYWTGKTKMNCIHQCVEEIKRNAYAHHIQRLMVLGNFALITGINPTEVNEWFLIVYADAYEWVELPNVSGMILFADGGYLASKPYASGGSYINKMSNYCKDCRYKIQQKNGMDACPFNYLYWYFLMCHRDLLQSNPRIAMMYKTFDRMNDQKKTAIFEDSNAFLEAMERGEIV